MEAVKELLPRINRFARPDDGIAWRQVGLNLILFCAFWALAYYSLAVSYILTLLLAVPTAGILARLFIIQHDCGHRSMFSSRQVGNMVGRTIGVVTLTPYVFWLDNHDEHHATSGNLDRRGFGDFKTLTVSEYRASGTWGRLGYRLYRFAPFFLTVGAVWNFVIKHRLPTSTPLARRRQWASVFWTNASISLVLVAAHLTIGLRSFLMVQAPITLLSSAVGIWLFFVQHQFEEAYWRRHDKWDYSEAAIYGSTFYDLPKWLHWWTGNIGYHPLHHLKPLIPNYRLAECWAAVPELHGLVTGLSLRDSIRSASLALWDEEQGRLVSFADA